MNQETSWHGTVEMIRRAATRKGREAGGYFTIEGIRLHERALRAGVQVEQAVVTGDLQGHAYSRFQMLLNDLQDSGCRLVAVPPVVIEELTAGRELGPVLGLVRIPQQPRLPDVLSRQGPAPPRLLVAVDVKDPGNVGALLRTAHACGATGFATTGISDPFHPRALRTTMGSLFKLPVLRFQEPLNLLAKLRESGVEAVGTVAAGGIPLPQATFSSSGVAVLIGSEAWGLSAQIQAAVDHLVSIPMKQGVDSFSVNAAAAIVLYEIGRG
jgi:TrmH family RNA methyltransferase